MEEPVYCPPPPPQPTACASLGTKQSLLSNFKCYLRTAWPQPKRALWKLAFRCRGCKYQRHTFGGGECLTPLLSQRQELALNGHTDTQRPTPTEGHTHHAVACTPGAQQLRTRAHTPTHTAHTLAHRGEGGFPECCLWPVGFGIFPAGEVSQSLETYILRSPGHEWVLRRLPSLSRP